MRHAFRLIFTVLMLMAGATAPTRAELHALIVGIDDYAHEQKLAGAVADADDLEGVITKLKPKSITVLRNSDASRSRIEQAWNAIVANAQRGATIIFTYAGHGGSEPWKSDAGRSETAESFLLQRFRAPRPSQDSAERILGKQLKSWFKKANEAKGGRLRIIFVADSCHAGGLMRSLDDRAGPTYRSGGAYEIPDAPIRIAAKDEAAPADLAHVTFIAATQADKKIPEVVIAGKKRGALSYAFARALEGHADRQGRGQLSNLDLQAFITRTVRQISEAQQTPEIQYRSGGENETILANVPSARDLTPTLATLSLRIDSADAAQRSAIKNNLVGVRIVDQGTADLIFDAKAELVLSGLGEPVAEKIKPELLQGVVDKWRVLPAIKALIQKAPLDLVLEPSDSRHPPGRPIAFRTAPLPHKFLSIINLAGDGTVQFLFPRPESNDPANGDLGAGKPYGISFKVSAPYGADHAIFISSSSSLKVLNDRLRSAVRVTDLPSLLKDALTEGTYAIGMQSLYTTAKP